MGVEKPERNATGPCLMGRHDDFNAADCKCQSARGRAFYKAAPANARHRCLLPELIFLFIAKVANASDCSWRYYSAASIRCQASRCGRIPAMPKSLREVVRRCEFRDLAARSARAVRELALENRGRREDRVRAAPAVSCARCTKQNAHEHTGSAEAVRPSLRNGFTAYNALSSVTGFVATVAP